MCGCMYTTPSLMCVCARARAEDSEGAPLRVNRERRRGKVSALLSFSLGVAPRRHATCPPPPLPRLPLPTPSSASAIHFFVCFLSYSAAEGRLPLARYAVAVASAQAPSASLFLHSLGTAGLRGEVVDGVGAPLPPGMVTDTPESSQPARRARPARGSERERESGRKREGWDEESTEQSLSLLYRYSRCNLPAN